ncbi:MAG: restriction endonuclease subunit S [Mycobacterium sp.]
MAESSIELQGLAVPGGLISGPFGSNLVSADYRGSGVPIIRGSNMGGRYLSGDFAYVSEEKYSNDLARSSVVPGDIVLTQRGTLGQVSIVPESGYPEYVVSQSQMGLRVDRRLADPQFVYYACTSANFLTQLSENAIATGVPHINLGILRRLTIPSMSLDSQSAIAKVLGCLDDKIAMNERIARLSTELAHAMVLDVIRSAQLGKASLMRTRFGELGKLFDGPHATPKRLTEGPFFLNISSLKSGRLDLAESDRISEDDFANWVRRVTPEEGDLLFSYETRLGEAALMPSGLRACLGRRMALLRPDQTRVDPVFLLHFYLSPQFQRIIAANTIHGATVPRIGLATMPNWEIEIPTYECQRTVSDRLHALQSRMIASERESDQLVMLRDALLPLLMSGKIRVEDAELVLGEVT